MSIGFERPAPRTLEEVAQPLPPSKGLITLHELRECCAIIARELIAARLRATPRAPAPVADAVRPAEAPACLGGELQERVLGYLSRDGQPRTCGEVGRAVGRPSPGVVASLAGLVQRGRVVRGDHPTYVWRGRPVATYQAVPMRNA